MDLFLLAWESTKALEGGGWPEVWGVPELVVSGMEGGVGRGLGHGDHAKLPALRCWVVGPGLGWGKRGWLLTPGRAPVKHDCQCMVRCVGLPYSLNSLAAQGSQGKGEVAIPSVLFPRVPTLSGTRGVPSGTQFPHQ